MDVILQGLVLMGFGMGFVGRFDSILPQDAPKKKPAAAASGNDDANIALAIAVALG